MTLIYSSLQKEVVMPTIDLPTNDVRWDRSGNSLHCLTPESLDATLAKLREIGYTVEDNRLDERSFEAREGVTPQMMEERGYSLYFAKLDVHKGKCNTCHQYIDTYGICKHGHKCENCGAVTYLDIVDGTRVEFVFVDDTQGWLRNYVRCSAKRWDIDTAELYLRPSTLEEAEFGRMSAKEARTYMERHSDKWESVIEDGVKLIKLHYAWSFRRQDDAVIETHDIYGHMYNHTIVRLWDGKEYSEHGKDFPIPDTINIYLDYLKK